MKGMMKQVFWKDTKGMDARVNAARDALFRAQEKSEEEPNSSGLIEDVRGKAMEFRKLKHNQLLFYKQRAKIRWAKEGDANTGFFHSYVKCRGERNKIRLVKTRNGVISTDPSVIKEEFTDHFKKVLTLQQHTTTIDEATVCSGPLMTVVDCRKLVREVTDIEIWQAVSSIGSDKAPGPDGFSSGFFKKNWSLIGKEVCSSIRHCLRHNALPKGMNSVYIALIPKVTSPETPDQFRPISCCNVMYKIISSILACRLREVLPSIINQAQGAFVEDRSIIGNIYLAHQLLSGYGRKNISERVAWKIDLSKAYDSVSWKFLDDMLRLLNFPRKFISWMNMCVQTASYSIRINGEMVDYFEGRRGLRQGDSISPFLFTIVMEYLSRSLLLLSKKNGFYFHPKCHRVKLSHILFADDLFLFSSGRNCSISALKSGVDHFLEVSGLVINTGKSQIFVGGMGEVMRRWVETTLNTSLHDLPVKYLGIPLNAKRLRTADCAELLDRMTKRLNSWNGRLLSRAGRAMLINSVLLAMVLYWARVFILPKQVVKAANAICANFLWKGGSSRKGGHLVAWDVVCRPKEEGGLGIKNLKTFNDALVMKQLWDFHENKQNLWVDWLKAYWSKGRDWWLDSVESKSSWIMQRLSYCKQLCTIGANSGSGGMAGIHNDNRLTVKNMYEKLRVQGSRVEWCDLVWNRFNAPRDSVNAWLACQDRLLTNNRILRMGGSVYPSCVLCGYAEESRYHLFFECPIAVDLWMRALSFIGVSRGPSQWHLLIPWFKRRSKDSLQTRFIAAAATRTMYVIWSMRNKKLFGEEEEEVNVSDSCRDIIGGLKMKLGAIDVRKFNEMDRQWLGSIRMLP